MKTTVFKKETLFTVRTTGVYQGANILTPKQYRYTLLMAQVCITGLTIGALAGIAILILG